MYWTTFKKCDFDAKVIDQSVAVDNLIYSFLNWGPWDRESFDIYVLNTHTLTWSALDYHENRDEPLKRKGHTIVAYEKKIYLWGGKNSDGLCSTLRYFDTKILNWSKPKVSGIIPSNRVYHSACISNAEPKMYIFGGCDPNTNQVLRDVHCLDLKTMIWSNIITTGEIPRRLNYLTAVVDNRMYIHGGYDRHKYCTDTMYLDLESNQWHRPETTGNIPFAKNNRSLFVHNNIIYIFGSCKGDKYGNFNDLYYLDTKRNHWNLINPRGKTPKFRNEQSCIVMGDKMFLLGSRPETRYICRERYKNTINVLDLNPSLETLAKITIAENGLDTSCLPTELRLAFEDENTDEDTDEDEDEDSDEDINGVTDECTLC